MLVWVVSKYGMLGRAIAASLESKKIKYISTSKDQVDILNISDIETFVNDLRITHIINCAAYTDVEKAETEKELAFAINVKGVENLAAIAKKKKAKLVHYSSDYVFDGRKKGPYLEIDECNPINYYGYTKYMSEKAAKSTLSDCLIIRTSWLFGLKKANFPSKMVALMKEKKEISVIKDQIGKATFCADLSLATIDLLDESGIFHFANDGIISWHDFALEIFKNLKTSGQELKCENIKAVLSDQFKTVAERPKYSVLNTDKFINLNKTKIRSFLEGLREYLTEEYGIY